MKIERVCGFVNKELTGDDRQWSINTHFDVCPNHMWCFCECDGFFVFLQMLKKQGRSTAPVEIANQILHHLDSPPYIEKVSPSP